MFPGSLFNPRWLGVIIPILLLGSGCAPKKMTPESDPQDIPGYHQLRETFGNRDFRPLRDRRIVLDPGHGGYFRGAVGPEGLTEAEVNLGVALYLRGLLEWAGAEVHMTRTADYDFLSAQDSLLSTDLAFRVDFTQSLQPEVFLSIHHNSTASADPTINETQTYYPLGAEGASLDLARAIHRHLVLKLEISPAKILPGNFHVLRKATYPAVLGEPAMISNPVMEGRLSVAASHELEAQAYFLGLLEYFAGGLPTWQAAQKDTLCVPTDGSLPPVSWIFEPGVGQVPGPDPSTFSLKVGGRDQTFHTSADGHTVTWSPSPEWVPGREQVLELQGRNLSGRATPVIRTVIQNCESTSERALAWFETGPGQSDPHYLLGTGDDQESRHLWKWELKSLSHPLPPGASRDTLPANLEWRRIHAEAPSGVSYDPGIELVLHHRLPSTQRFVPMGSRIPFVAVDPIEPLWFEAAGLQPMVDPDQAAADTARTVPGASRNWTAALLVPQLYGKTVVLNPDGGGTRTDGRGPLGLRGAELNLKTALILQSMLRGAGARVFLTRQGEYALPAHDKIQQANKVNADLFLTIGRSPGSTTSTISHHPGSVVGEKWALSQSWAQRDMATLGQPVSTSIHESYQYLLRHTSCPALEVRLPGLDSTERELEATEHTWAQREAQALLLGVTGALSAPEDPVRLVHMSELLAALPAHQVLKKIERAKLDGNFPWAPPTTQVVPAGSDSLSYEGGARPWDPGFPDFNNRHTLQLNSGRTWQLWLVQKIQDRWQSRLMMEGP